MMTSYMIWVMVPESMPTSASREVFYQPPSMSINVAPACVLGHCVGSPARPAVLTHTKGVAHLLLGAGLRWCLWSSHVPGVSH